MYLINWACTPKDIFTDSVTLFLMSIHIRNKEVLVRFGERLKQVRLAKGLTQEQLAYEADVELSQIHRLESGKTNPTLSTITTVAKALNVTLSELFKGVEL